MGYHQLLTGNHGGDNDTMKRMFTDHHADCYLRQRLSGGQVWRQKRGHGEREFTEAWRRVSRNREHPIWTKLLMGPGR